MTPEVFNCPSCSAPLQPNGAAATVQCPYCGESVVVPPGLRTPAPRPAVVVEFPASTYHTTLATPATPVSTSGSGGCIVGIIVLVLAVFGLIVGINWLSGSFDTAATAPNHAIATALAVRLEPADTPTPDFATLDTAVEGATPGPGQFDTARAVAVDPAGNIYLTNSKPGRVLKFDTAHRFVAAVPLGIDYPTTLAADRAGNLYTIDSEVIRKYSPTGDLLDTYRFADQDVGFFGYEDLAVLPDGEIWALLGNTDSLVHLGPTGAEVGRVVHALRGHTPAGADESQLRIALAPSGGIYLLGRDTDTIYHLDGNGKYLTRYAAPGTGSNQVHFDNAFAVDASGRIYVAASPGIVVLDPTGHYLGQIEVSGYVAALASPAAGSVLALSPDTLRELRLTPATLSAAVTPWPTDTPEPTPTPLPGIGDTVNLEGWVLSFARTDSRTRLTPAGGDPILEARGRFIMIWLDARNRQTSPHSLLQDFSWDVVDDQDHAISVLTADDSPYLAPIIANQGRVPPDTLADPQALIHPLLLFEVPDDIQPTTLLVRSTVGGATATFALPATPAP